VVLNEEDGLSTVDLADSVVERARLLQFDLDRYFLPVSEAIHIDPEKLILSRARPKGIANAVTRWRERILVIRSAGCR
jgi:hypothetical protein